MTTRNSLASYDRQKVFCRGRIEQFSRGGGNNAPVVLLRQVRIEDTIALDHLWLRVGVPDYLFSRFKEGEWISFYARVNSYRNMNTGILSYGLVDPEDIVRSYS
jgi:hypothetical protein